MAAPASTRLDMYQTPQQTAEMNPSHWPTRPIDPRSAFSGGTFSYAPFLFAQISIKASSLIRRESENIDLIRNVTVHSGPIRWGFGLGSLPGRADREPA